MPTEAMTVGKSEVNMTTEPEQRCYACGHGWVSLGTDAGVCPECGSTAVTPVGPINVTSIERVEAESEGEDTHAEVYRLEAMDGSGKPDGPGRGLTYWVGLTGGEARIPRIGIGDAQLGRSDASWPASEDTEGSAAEWLTPNICEAITTELGVDRDDIVLAPDSP
jgi:hypothetical protein